jgi:uncharacterized membrane protein
MKPLIILVVVFNIALLITRLLYQEYDAALAARIAMSVMLVFTSIGHFKFSKGMTMMLPSFIPYQLPLVYLTGLLEIACAVGLLIPQWKVTSAWVLIIFFILILPVNINAAIKRVDYEKGTLEGKGPSYLWFRIPLQILFITWVYFSAIRF